MCLLPQVNAYSLSCGICKNSVKIIHRNVSHRCENKSVSIESYVYTRIGALGSINFALKYYWMDFMSVSYWIHLGSKLYKEILEICWIWTIISLVHRSRFLYDIEEKGPNSKTNEKFVNDTESTETVRFPKWLRLVQWIAWIFKFIDKCRRKSISLSELTAPEIDAAELRWIGQSQSNFFFERNRHIGSKQDRC